MALGSTTDLNIKIDAATASAEAGLARLQRSTLAYESSLRRAQLAAASLDHQLEQESAQRYAAQTQALQQAGRGLLIFGGATAAGLALSAKAAIDWESAWTGVRKTLDGSDAELSRAEEGLRNLAKTLPTSHEEIAAVAEAAGQLGIKAKDIVPFTKTMVDLGQTTNLTADQAATAMARFGNIMQTPQDQVDRLGSSLVALGNNGASTEAEILTLGNRIAAAGQLVGLSEGEVLGLANAMSSLGVEAEAGGTAISMTLREMSSAVASGSADMEEFARVAGMSGPEFQRLFNTDAASALESFTSGLGRMKARGEDLNAVLGGLGITGVRQVDTLLRLAQSGDQLSDSLKLGNEAYRENTALVEEANKRYDTTAAKLEIAKNQVVDLGIGLGEALLPALGKTAGLLSQVGGFLNDLPGPVKTLITTFGVGAAAIGLFGGAALMTVGKVRDMRTELAGARESLAGVDKRALAARGAALGLAAALPILASATGQTSDSMNDFVTTASLAAAGFAVTGGPWGAAIGGAVGLLMTLTGGTDDAAAAQSRMQAIMQGVSATLDTQTGALTRNTDEWARSKLAEEGVFDAAEGLGVSLDLVTRAALGNKDALAQLNGELDRIERDDPVKLVADDQVDSLRLVRDRTNEFAAATEDAQRHTRQSSEANQDNARTTANVANKAEDAAKAIRELVAAQRAAAVAAIQNKRDQLALISTMQSAREEARRGKRTLDESTKAGQNNWNALLDLADQWENSSKKVRHADGAYKDVRKTFIEVAQEMGASEKRAKKLADRFLSVPGAARKAASGAKDASVDIGKSLRSIRDEPVAINLTASAARIAKVEWQLEQRAAGGAIGGGMQGVDSVPALLMPGEHVFTTSDVLKAGRGNLQAGQKTMFAIRRMIQRGEMGKLGDIPAFRDGGAILDPRARLRGLPSAIADVESYVNSASSSLSELLSAAVSKALTLLPTAGQLGPDGTLTPAQLARGQGFARSQAGKPYSWGGVGPSGYDCSGFQSAVLNSAVGRNPYSRLGSTGTMPWSGSSPGVGRYTIGWFTGSPGHTSGNIAGLGVESRGGDGVVVGSGATPPVGGMFNSVMHYDKGGVWPDGTLGVNMSGGDELVINPRRMAKGGEVKAKPISDKQLRAVVAGFHIGGGQDVAGTRSEIQELMSALRELLGKDSPVVDRIGRVGVGLVELQKRQDRLVRQQERNSEQFQQIVQAQRAYAQSVTEAFRPEDPFAGDLATFQRTITGDKRFGRRARRNLQELRRKGLDGSLFRQLAESGNVELIAQFADLSRRELSRREFSFERRNRITSSVGRLAGREVFGGRRQEASRDVRQLSRQIQRLGNVIERREGRVQRVVLDIGGGKELRGVIRQEIGTSDSHRRSRDRMNGRFAAAGSQSNFA